MTTLLLTALLLTALLLTTLLLSALLLAIGLLTLARRSIIQLLFKRFEIVGQLSSTIESLSGAISRSLVSGNLLGLLELLSDVIEALLNDAISGLSRIVGAAFDHLFCRSDAIGNAVSPER